MRRRLDADPGARALADAIGAAAVRMLDEPPVRYEKQGRRLLHRSREALERVLHLAFHARRTGEQRFVARAETEMLAAAAMPDWNPSHFLDTAEMTLALAIGYDWLHGCLAPDTAERVRAAIEKKGLAPYLAPGARHGWEKGRNNWTQVCHAGMLAGALALQEHDPARAAGVVRRAVEGLPHAMRADQPDGAYPEGTGYWSYGTTFNILAVAMLESALGRSFGLAEDAAFLRTGDFMLHMTGPTGATFNFSDSSSGRRAEAAMLWLAGRARRPDWRWWEMPRLDDTVRQLRESGGRSRDGRLFPLFLLWADASMRPSPPKGGFGVAQGINPVAAFRTSWEASAAWAAVKAGTPSANHAHMDVGSFVYDAGGVRWAMDLGAQDYHGMESRGLEIWNSRPGSDRWKIFRHHNRAHNTLTVDGEEQRVDGRATLTAASSDGWHGWAEMDLTPVYQGLLASARRRVQLSPGGQLTVQDTVATAGRSRRVQWTMATPARWTADGDAAGWLEQQGRRLRVEAAGPGLRFVAVPAKGLNEFDEPNRGVWLLKFEIEVAPGQPVGWTVTLRPTPEAAASAVPAAVNARFRPRLWPGSAGMLRPTTRH